MELITRRVLQTLQTSLHSNIYLADALTKVFLGGKVPAEILKENVAQLLDGSYDHFLINVEPRHPEERVRVVFMECDADSTIKNWWTYISPFEPPQAETLF